MAESMAEAMHVLEDPAWRAPLRRHHNALRTGILVGNILPAFRTLLTDAEYSCVEAKVGDVDRVDELVKILLTKDDATFDEFCSVLENNGYRHWARKLRGQGIFTRFVHLKEYNVMDIFFALWLVYLAARPVLQSVYQWVRRLACMAFACTKYVLTKEYTAVCFILRCGYLAARWILQLVHWWMRCSVRITIVCSQCVLMKILVVVYFTVGLVYVSARWVLQLVYPQFVIGSVAFVDTRGMLMKVYTTLFCILGLIHSAAAWILRLLYRCLCFLAWVTSVCLLCACPPLGVGYLAARYICQWRRRGSAVSDEATVKVE